MANHRGARLVLAAEELVEDGGSTALWWMLPLVGLLGVALGVTLKGRR